MKYGSQLSRRSVPEWRGHNILYSDLKQEIKDLTTGSWNEERYRSLEEFFYDELSNVSLFVKSKMSEIQHRISVCQNLVDEAASASKKGDVEEDAESSERFYQLHRETAKLTSDIQKLSRFIVAQHTGFRKLIKKFRRHSRSHGIDDFERTLEAPNSFAHTDFTPSILELSLLYDIIRSRKFTSLQPKSQESDAARTSPVNRLVYFDMEMFRYPVARAKRYWIHPDHLIEAKVVLLQHTKLVVPESETEKEQTSTVYLDTEQFEYAQLVKDPAQLRQVTLGTSKSRTLLSAPTGGIRGTTTYEINHGQEKLIRAGNLSTEDVENLEVSGRLALGWILSKGAVVSAEVRSRRSRFRADNFLAVVDSNIQLLGDKSSPSSGFPYSVLEIRSLDHESIPLIDELLAGNIVYPVSDLFSIYAYALIRTRHDFSVKPRWLDVLDSGVDIRQNPPDEDGMSVRSKKTNPKLRPRPSHGILLLDNHHGDNTSDEDQSMRIPQEERYWNEFDDGDEGLNETFAVFVDAEDESRRRARTAARVSQPVLALGNSVRRKLSSIRSLWSSDFEDRARDTDQPYETSSDSTAIDADTPGHYSPRIRARYDEEIGRDIPGYGGNVEGTGSDLALSFITFVCLSMSLALTVVILTILAAEDISEVTLMVQLVLSSGLIFAVLLSVAGLAAYSIRQAQDWRIQVVVQSIFFSVICFGIGGVVLIISPISLEGLEGYKLEVLSFI